jgi:hypothetical protein
MSGINWDNFPGYPKSACYLSQHGYENLLKRCERSETTNEQLKFSIRDLDLNLILAREELEQCKKALELASEELYGMYELTGSNEVYRENCKTIGDVYKAIIKGFLDRAKEAGDQA